MKPTHALVLDVVVGQVVVAFDIIRGNAAQVKAEHKKWLAKIKRSEWVSIPTDLPLTVKSSTIATIRVVKIDESVHRAEAIEKKWAGDPRRAAYMRQFINNAEPRRLDPSEEPEGVDILDQGFIR